MAVAMTLQKYMEDQGVPYEVVSHPRAMRMATAAEAAHVPDDRVAKTVVLEDEGGYLLAIVPASHHIQLGEVHRWLDRHLGLATEDEVGTLFQDCELGAIPPIGTAYGLDVVMEDDLAAQRDVFFEAGDHCSLIHVSAEDFRRLIPNARIGRFSRHD
jgi:Ala-tRNA(Pro) deacylase